MKTYEIDYYANEDAWQGKRFRYHVRTARIEVPDDVNKESLPFRLTETVGEHHGIKRITEIEQPAQQSAEQSA